MDALSELGFRGDAKLVFDGFAERGSKRLSRSALDYVKCISREAQRKYAGHESIGRFAGWLHCRFGGLQRFLQEFGFTGPDQCVQVGEFAARATALGFKGNALEVATRAARLEDGVTMSVDTLTTLFGSRLDGPLRTLSITASERQRQDTPKKSTSTRHLSARSPSEGAPGSEQKRQQSRISRSLTPPRSCDGKPRPAWTSEFAVPIQDWNQFASAPTRHYFSDSLDRSVRRQLQEVVSERLNRQKIGKPPSRQRSGSKRLQNTGRVSYDFWPRQSCYGFA